MKVNKLMIISMVILLISLTLISCSTISSVNNEPSKKFEDENVGEFTTTDLNGNTFTEEIFAQNDLTMVNIFTTWCSSCIEEIPHLEQLSKNMDNKNVAVIGIVLDTVNNDGSINDETIALSQNLASKTGATYPFLIPDEGNINGRLEEINAVPETFFVDSNGNFVGDTYIGSNDLEGWTEIVNKELENIKE
ncbi:MAG: TlpA disulfide reductase family protein [Lachnospirales bacterium]